MSAGLISQAERLLANRSLLNLQKLAAALGVRLSELMSDGSRIASAGAAQGNRIATRAVVRRAARKKLVFRTGASSTSS